MPDKPSPLTDTPRVSTTSFTHAATVPRRRPLRQRLQTLSRWLHIYASLLGLMTVLFFAITGLTLNHPHWFDSGYHAVREESGTFDRSLITAANGAPKMLEIVEFIRAKYQVRCAVRDFQADDFQIAVAFAGPGYTADVSIDRQTAEYQFSEVRMGLTAIINDLHKGRDTGTGWAIFIDISAILLVFISLSGVLLLFWLRRIWRSGILTILGGTIAIAIFIWISVP
jgi:uncharacterized protein